MSAHQLVVGAAERIFFDLANIQDVLARSDDTWKQEIWRNLENSGLTQACIPEALGGPGIEVEEAMQMLRAAGRHALAVPLAETVMAGWLLSQVELTLPQGSASVAPSGPYDKLEISPAGKLDGVVHGLPFGRDVDYFAVLAKARADDGYFVCLVRASDAEFVEQSNLSGDPCDTVVFRAIQPIASSRSPAELTPEVVLRFGAAVRAQQIAGALETVLQTTLAYASERRAFDRPIAKFQAVQHAMAQLAGEVAVALSTAASAAQTIQAESLGGTTGLLEIASAKVRCAEAAQKASEIAHQIHGAIGVTDEHILHRLTLRAQGWRDDFGNELYWSLRLGQLAAKLGAEEIWPLLASR